MKLNHACGTEASKLLAEHQVNFAIVPFVVASENALNIIKIFDLSLVSIVHCDHPLAAMKQPNPLQTLIQYRQIVLIDFSDLTGQKDKSTMSHHLWRMRDINSIIQSVNSKIGWTFMSYDYVEKQLKDGKFKVISTKNWDDKLKIPIVALHHFSDQLGPAANLFVSELADTSNK